MGKLLLIVSFVFMVLTAALGFLNKQNLTDTKAKLEETTSSLAQKSKQYEEVAKASKVSSENLATATAEAEQLKTQISSIQSELASAKSQASDATNQKTTLESQLAEAQANLQAKTQEVDQLKASAQPAQQDPNNELLVQLEEQKTLNARLQTELDSSKSKITTLSQEAENRRQKIMRNSTEGQILAVNPAWNFVVLSLGDKNGVVNNAELLVKRGRQLVGKVRVTSVEPSTSIADIVANSVPTGTTINPGDQVIYQAVEE